MKKKEIIYRAFISQSIPDVPVCYHPLCFSLLLSANDMLFIAKGIQGHWKKKKREILKLHLLLPLSLRIFFICRHDQRISLSCLTGEFSTALSFLGYPRDILHWYNAFRPWNFKAEEKFCTFRYTSLLVLTGLCMRFLPLKPHIKTTPPSVKHPPHWSKLLT